MSEPQRRPAGRRIAAGEAFSVPEVWEPVLRFCIEAVGADNIMFAIDYPYQLTDGAVGFLDSASISVEDKNKIFHQNAERIFGVSPAPTISGVSL